MVKDWQRFWGRSAGMLAVACSAGATGLVMSVPSAEAQFYGNPGNNPGYSAPYYTQQRDRRAPSAREAQSRQQSRGQRADVPQKADAAPKRATVAAAATKPVTVGEAPEPLVAVISVPQQRIKVYSASGVIAESKVSTGKSGHDTPTGVFSILQRNRYHESNIYSGAPMPYMQRLTWSGIALHEGVVPGYPASHGCIRLPVDFANQMWGLGRIGMRVVVAPGETPAVPVASPRLPAPVMTPVPASDLPAPVQTAALAVAGDDANTRLVDPYRFALVGKLKAQAERVAAEARIKPARELAAEASAEANRASDELRRLERVVADAEEDAEEKRAALARDQMADAESDVGRQAAAAGAAWELAQKAHAEALVAERAKSDAAFAAVRPLRDAEAALEDATTAQRAANAGTEPVTIFVSRKEGRVLIRQGFLPISDEPVTFTEPDRPLGTHVFTAMASHDGGARLDWQVVTVPNNPPNLAKEAERGRRGVKAAEREPQVVLPASSAAEALARFELPEATRKLIANRVWPGASLIVSDYGVSGETGKGTDFIVLTK